LTWLGLLLVTAAQAAPPVYLPEVVPVDNGMTLRRTADADPKFAFAVAQVCAEAVVAYRDEAHLSGPAQITVFVSRTDEALSNVVTDRRAAIYVVYQKAGHVGQDVRWCGPVGVLCAAVAELFNPARVPGLERFLAAKVAVPAVHDALGDKAWPRPYDYLARDGIGPLTRQMADAAAHPQWAAAGALAQVAERLKLDGLVALLKDLPGQGGAAFRELQTRATARDAALAAAFEPWKRAVDLPRDAQGGLPLATFTDPADLDLVSNRGGAEAKLVTDDGPALAITFGKGAYPYASGIHDDWRFADWTGFKTLEFDAVSQAAAPVKLFTYACDAPDHGHGWLFGSQVLAPGQTTHVVLHLVPPRVGGEDDLPYRTAA
jgi:hypothetical protein